MISFFILTPYDLGEIGPLGQSFSIPGQWLGPMGLFTAILVAIISTRIFVAITRKGLIIKMPENVPEFISKSFSSLIPRNRHPDAVYNYLRSHYQRWLWEHSRNYL